MAIGKQRTTLKRPNRLQIAALIAAVCAAILVLVLFFQCRALFDAVSGLTMNSADLEAKLGLLLAGQCLCIALCVFVAVFAAMNINAPFRKMTDKLAPYTPLKLSAFPENDAASALEKMTDDLCLQIAHLKRNQQLMIDRAVDVVCVLDGNAQFTMVSSAAERAWGYKSSELIGKSIFSILKGNTEEFNIAHFIGVTRSIDKIALNTQIMHKNGGILDVSLTGHWSASEGGLFCIVHDLTEQKQLERAKRDFVAMLAHDIRTPLASVMGVLTLLEKGALGNLSERGLKISRDVDRDCARMLRLLDDMLDLDKIEVGSYELVPAPMDVRDAVMQAVNTVRGAADAKSITIRTQLEPSLCMADELRLMQVLVNLLTNAVKFSDNGTEIGITLQTSNGLATCAVVDHGRGIPADKLEKVFEKFQQVEARDGRDKGGTGLGLAICKAIINQHGGTIGVESEPGKGSRFWFTLPALAEQQAADSAAQTQGNVISP